MKKSRFTEPQILAILKQGESGVPVPDLCREHGMITEPLGYLTKTLESIA